MPKMKCGHMANGSDRNGNPVCVICAGINAGYNVVDNDTPDLSGRMSMCMECGRTVPSKDTLPFFKYQPDKRYDSHYDGCHGWN